MNRLMVFLSLAVITFPTTLLSQNSPNQINPGVVSSILRLENYIQAADENLQRYQKSIDRCDKNIQNSTEILDAARKAGDSQSEKNVSEAIRKSQKTKQKYVGLTSKTKERQAQSRETMEVLMRKVQSESASERASLLNYTGKVTVTLANGKVAKLSELNGATLEDGDMISTGDKSSVELQFLQGRGNMVLGENSKVTFSSQDSIDVLNMLDGRVKMQVEKVEAYYDNLVKKYDAYKKYITSPDSMYEVQMKRLKARIQKKLELRVRVSAALAVRGTEFTIQCNGDTSEVVVLEGCIEMKSLKNNKTVLINGGQKGTVMNDGTVLPVQSIDTKTLKEWWKDEE